MPEPIPAEIRDFLRSHISSIAHLEMLLALHAQPDRAFSVEEIAKQLYIGTSMVGPMLERLRASRMIALQEGEPASYRYQPETPEIGRLADELKRVYLERPVSTVDVIYALPTDKLQNFADAFRIRKKEEE